MRLHFQSVVKNTIIALTLIPLFLGILPALVGCEEDTQEGATSGHRIVLKTRLEAPEIATPFTNSQGWKITLKSASIATGAFYYFDGTPAFTQAPSLPPKSRWATLLGPSIAWAHPGHYIPGNARGQMLKEWSADLFAGVAELPDGDGITGLYRSARFSFATPSTGPEVTRLGANVIMVQGFAEKGDSGIYFSASTDLNTLSSRAADGYVQGCTLDEVDVQGDGTLRVTLQPSVWFHLVDFSGLEPGSQEAPTALPARENAHIAFLTGLAQISAYHFHYER